MTPIPEEYNPKSFWSRPEGTAGMLVAVVVGMLAIYGIGLAMPFIVTLLQNMLTASLLAIAIIVLGYIVLNKQTWRLFTGMFKMIMRRLTNKFVSVFPIDILKDYVDRLAHKKEEIYSQINNLRGQMGQLKVTIDRNESERQQAINIAKAAKEKGKQGALVLNARSAGRLQKSNITLQQLYTKLEGLMRMLNKMKEVTEFMYADIKEDVNVMERQYNAINTAHRAMTAAMAFIRDSSDDKQLYDQATEYLLNDYGQKLGEIDQFMEVATPFIEGVDLQNMAFEIDALKGLEAWEQKADKLILGDTKTLLIGNEELAPLLEFTKPEKVAASSGTSIIPNKKYLKRK
jgi:hypothetical protein